jgi:hypothetical protein
MSSGIRSFPLVVATNQIARFWSVKADKTVGPTFNPYGLAVDHLDCLRYSVIARCRARRIWPGQELCDGNKRENARG